MSIYSVSEWQTCKKKVPEQRGCSLWQFGGPVQKETDGQIKH